MGFGRALRGLSLSYGDVTEGLELTNRMINRHSVCATSLIKMDYTTSRLFPPLRMVRSIMMLGLSFQLRQFCTGRRTAVSSGNAKTPGWRVFKTMVHPPAQTTFWPSIKMAIRFSSTDYRLIRFTESVSAAGAPSLKSSTSSSFTATPWRSVIGRAPGLEKRWRRSRIMLDALLVPQISKFVLNFHFPMSNIFKGTFHLDFSLSLGTHLAWANLQELKRPAMSKK